MNIRNINSIHDYLEIVFSIRPYSMFRGVHNSDYELISRVGRADAEQLQARYGGTILKLEMALLQQFKTQSRPHLKYPPQSEWEWLCLMQHHGTPTRLIDWTRNALVAVYFSLFDLNNRATPTNTDGAVYMLPPKQLKNLDGHPEPYELTEVSAVELPHVSPRVSAQHALFTIHPEPSKPYEDESVLKVIIPKGMKPQLADQIARLGVHYVSMFPGLDSINEGSRLVMKF